MKKALWKRILTIVIILTVVLCICSIFSTGLSIGKSVLNYKGTQVALTEDDNLLMWCVFVFKFYNYGIGGCPFEEGISVSIGNREFALAADSCYSAKDLRNGHCIEFNRLEWAWITNLFHKHWEDTLLS